MKRAASSAIVLAAALSITSCRREAPNATPEGAVRELVERLRVHDGDGPRAEAVFELLSEQTKANLTERAERYSRASGKHISAAMMVAPASFIERFSGRTYESEEKGKYALVKVRGLLEKESSVVRCIYETGGWRVHIDLPPLAPEIVRPREEVRGR